eukprot:scaffold3648_cov388-Prasinococcus_capsulatus_cf.AAC.2
MGRKEREHIEWCIANGLEPPPSSKKPKVDKSKRTLDNVSVTHGSSTVHASTENADNNTTNERPYRTREKPVMRTVPEHIGHTPAEGNGRQYTVTIALPGSIIDNAQSQELSMMLAGSIARAATIFQVDEVVVWEEKFEQDQGKKGYGGANFLARVLQYLETPQYLRKALIPRHKDLQLVGLLPPLDAPHHARKHEHVPFREGVTLKSTAEDQDDAQPDK